jgi:uncharacterized membrane protein
VKKVKTKTIAVAVVYAALYAALVIVLGPFSYGPVQVRLADAMVALVPIFGWAGILGHALGVFISNIFSPLGWIDLLNTIPSFLMAFAIWKLRNRSVIAGTVMYSIVLGGTVGAMLSYVYGLPLIAEFAYVLVGNLIASTVIGYPVYKAIKKTNIQRWFETGK